MDSRRNRELFALPPYVLYVAQAFPPARQLRKLRIFPDGDPGPTGEEEAGGVSAKRPRKRDPASFWKVFGFDRGDDDAVLAPATVGYGMSPACDAFDLVDLPPDYRPLPDEPAPDRTFALLWRLEWDRVYKIVVLFSIL